MVKINSLFTVICIFTIGAQIAAADNAENVPVLLWGKQSVTYLPALSDYKNSEFDALVQSQASKNTFTAIFVEDKLSTEDLSQCKLGTQTCFKNLQKIERKTYLPNVESPLRVFDKVSQSIFINEEGELSENVVVNQGKTVVFYFQGENFAAHDEYIERLVEEFKKDNDDLLIIYTGKSPSFDYTGRIRSKRQAPKQAGQDGVVLRVEPHFLMFYKNFSYFSDGKTKQNIRFSTASKVNETASTMAFAIEGEGKTLVMDFKLDANAWTISSLSFDGNNYYSKQQVNVNNLNFTYICNNWEHFQKGGQGRIAFSGVQFQVNWDKEAKLEVFGDTWDCVGFTSPGILAGLFIVLIFISIASAGITWMMDINTMDRFDDPKGKTITINASD
uniref:Putative vacuolar h+-atpase v0 sector accessory subunit s1 n=1 Tax=Corethrella appendiculata TaxID=1370023 RepID=U5EP38_9DIPT